ncbi:hypothetical protein DFS34DRAFT_634605 [Phlyctochytrium arcticum]|nr:hypothetical protein DFS34DRAFT_634605 [Phlyctochytrium arcticum]
MVGICSYFPIDLNPEFGASLAQKSRPKTSSVSLSTQTCEELLKQLVADNIHLYRAETEQVCVSQMPDSATNLSQEPSEYVRLVDSARTVSNIGGTSGRPESLYPTLEREPYNDLGIDNGLAKTPDNSESLYPTLEEQPYSVVVKAVDFALEKSKRDLHTTFQTDQLFYKEHIRTSPLRFLLTPTILRIINTSTGHCVKEDCIPIPCVSPLTWYDGFIAYKSGNAAVGRMIYSTLATTRCTEHTKGSYHITLRSNGELLYLKRSSIQMIEFWKSWIYFEWKLGHSSNAYDILAFALSILGSSHLEALEQFWQSCANTLAIEETFERQDQVTYPIASTPEAKPMAVDQDITPPLPSWTFEGYRSPQSQFAVTPSPPRSVFLEGKERNFADTPVFPETPLQDLIKRVGASSSATPTPTPRAFGSLLRSGRGPKLAGSTPFARRRADIYGDIMGKLQDMTLGSPMPPSQHQEEEKENAAQQESTIVKMEPGKVAKPPKVGVRFGPTDGSRVTILTPVRTKKREKELLGSEHVITPVRRSMRNFKEADYVTAPPSKNPLSDDPISTPTVAEPTTDRLLQNYGYAYKPNKHLDQTTTPMSRRRSTMKQERK